MTFPHKSKVTIQGPTTAIQTSTGFLVSTIALTPEEVMSEEHRPDFPSERLFDGRPDGPIYETMVLPVFGGTPDYDSVSLFIEWAASKEEAARIHREAVRIAQRPPTTLHETELQLRALNVDPEMDTESAIPDFLAEGVTN
jgi:hypothetical protein